MACAKRYRHTNKIDLNGKISTQLAFRDKKERHENQTLQAKKRQRMLNASTLIKESPHSRPLVFIYLFFICFVPFATLSQAQALSKWKRLARGMKYRTFRLSGKKTPPQILHALRINPRKVRFYAILSAKNKAKSKSAKQWAIQKRMQAVINLGMYQQDHSTHVGYLRIHRYKNNRHWNRRHLSAFVFGRKRRGIPHAQILDLDNPRTKRKTKYYRVVIQNLRLIKKSGRKGMSVWKKQTREWSEAALAMDRQGRILFLFTRSRFSMPVFNQKILSLPLGIIRAMHLEGNSVASLSIRTKKFTLNLNGSFGTGSEQWPIPNVLGVKASSYIHKKKKRRRKRRKR